MPSATAYIQQQKQKIQQGQMQHRIQANHSRQNNIDNKIIDTIHSSDDIDLDELNLDEEDVNVSYEKYLTAEHSDEFEQQQALNDANYNEDEDEDYTDSDTYKESDDDIEADFDDVEEPELYTDDFHQKSVFNEDTQYYDPKQPSPPRSPIFDQIQQEQNQFPRKKPVQPKNKPKKPSNNNSWNILTIAGTVGLVSFLVTVIAYYVLNNNQIPVPEFSMRKINAKFQYFDEKLNQLESETRQSNRLLDNGINKLSKQIHSLEQNIQKSPVSYKNNQIQITPELHQFLFKFIENYSQKQTSEELTRYIDEKLKSFSITEIESMIQDMKNFQSGQYEAILSQIMSKLPKTQDTPSEELKAYIDSQVTQALDHLNEEIHSRLSYILDNLTIVNNTIIPDTQIHPSNEIWLNSMLDLFSRGSIKVNYADYSLGARILGFLTSYPKNKTHSIWYKMAYGWWIYSENKHDQHNANHVLMDDDATWICDNSECQLGLRLYSAIIPTDLLIELEGADTHTVELGFKPNSRTGYDKLSQFDGMSSKTNPYLKKFKLIKSIKLSSGLVHVRFPIRFVNLQVSGRDVYLKFTPNSKNPIHVKRVKVYGINEVDAVKYADQFKLMIGQFTQAQDVESAVEDTRKKNDRIGHYDLDKDIYL
ncbi:uncharacterized protein SPAPADRAFT_48439 [Spathaspora passalidarum NRRL Y-27907]|uniref:SUN domain-containing protein n=1 Tax=Spathaspora passalidarum (strain NRRL Y-27907 / 11-Y1) TaxID=619300 RepID=G3AH17_SPAPN|nr:uncharacterized protein SPAPADRAFT_48439 [Spathaspora passalidarum NRRL Y-27907]EGW35447.1 hypothetical protein SPAPADRAFT_48439 [Spathaspora passalidarum NRRL Y-27907]